MTLLGYTKLKTDKKGRKAIKLEPISADWNSQVFDVFHGKLYGLASFEDAG